MWMDVRQLRDFYASPVGHVVRRLVRRRIRDLWPDARGLNVLGLGYATPYLRPYKDTARRVIGFMPAGQGGVRWPAHEPSHTALVDEQHLPLPDASMDRVLVVHGVENAAMLQSMMREIWRVTAPEGRVILVVPNRHGIWARFDSTPFGHGRPFTTGQVERFLDDCLFSFAHAEGALYPPPFAYRLWMTSSGTWENAGHRFWRAFGGVLVVEATKHVAAIKPLQQRASVLAPVKQLAAGGRRWRPLRPTAAYTDPTCGSGPDFEGANRRPVASQSRQGRARGRGPGILRRRDGG